MPAVRVRCRWHSAVYFKRANSMHKLILLITLVVPVDTADSPYLQVVRTSAPDPKQRYEKADRPLAAKDHRSAAGSCPDAAPEIAGGSRKRLARQSPARVVTMFRSRIDR